MMRAERSHHHRLTVGRVIAALLLVAAENSEQTGQHRAPHLRVIDRDRVFDADRGRIVRGIAQFGVIVRPDQYVANVLPLTARAELTAFFAGFLIDQATSVAS